MYRVKVKGGVRCVVEEINPSGRRAVLFVHGWPLARQIFEYQLNVLPQSDIRCISFDIRGYGQSDKPWSGYHYDRLADDLREIIDAIDCKCMTLCGFSMGGAVCVRYMSRHRAHKINKLALIGAAVPQFIQSANQPYGMTREDVNNYIALARNDRPQLCDTFGRMCFASNPSESFLRWFSSLSMEAAGHATIEGLVALRDEELYNDCQNIRVPTAILHGVHDRICPYPFAEQMRQLIPNSFLTPFQNSGHCLFYDERDKCNLQLTEFINSY